LADARRKAEAAVQEKMQSMAGGLGLPPGLLGGFGSS
jgi:nucleoid-associated protein EbfC